MGSFQTVSTWVVVLLPFFSLLPEKAIAQSIIPAATSPAIVPADDLTQTTVTTQDQFVQIEGGVQIDNNLFHRFESFSLESGSTANFTTAPLIQSIISQISGGNASYINGVLQVSGSEANFYLINPSGVLFGPDAQLNLGGNLTATTADRIEFGDAWLDVEKTQDYSALTESPSAYQFSVERPGSVVNQGNLEVSNSQSIQFVGGDVVNTGTLTAPAGEVTLSAVPGESLIRLDAAGALLSVEVATEAMAKPFLRSITSDQSFTPLLLPELLTGESPSQVNSLRLNEDGSVSLVEDRNPTVLVAGDVDVSTRAEGEKGGQINLLGSAVEVAEAELNASGHAGGGLIRVGGDYQGQGLLPTADTTFFEGRANADALVDGDGGQVIVWSDEMTELSGLLSAKGAGAGAGGLVETSGLESLVVGDRTQVITDADSGDLGTWLLDPADLTVVAAEGTADTVADTNSLTVASTVNASTLVNALDGTNVTLQATNSISVNTAVDASDNGAAGNLHLQAPTLNLNDVILLEASSQLTGTATTVNLSTDGSLQNAVDAIATDGTINLAAGTYQDNREIVIDRSLTLQGQGYANTILNGQRAHRLLNISSGQVTADGITIQNGRATTGGGILVSGSGGLALSNGLLENNSASEEGGAIAVTGNGISTITTTTLAGNQSSAGDGGAIATQDQHQLAISRTTLSNNTAFGAGGAIKHGATGTGSLVITNSTLSGNNALTSGGGSLVLEPFTNTALSHVTIANNAARSAGGGLFIRSSNAATLSNTIIANNSAATGPDIVGTFTSNGYNIVKDQLGSSGYIASDLPNGSDPLLLPLADNGGPTLTHALIASSPAINSGTGVGPDQRGGGSNGVRDIGAYERLTDNSLVFFSGLGQTTVVNTAFANPVEVKVTDALGGVLEGVVVEFLLGGSTIVPIPTNADGIAEIFLIAFTTTGEAVIEAQSPNTAQQSGVLFKIADAPDSLVITSGNNQSGIVNTAFADQVAVQVRDQYGNAVEGVQIDFSVLGTDASGTLSNSSDITDLSGESRATVTANTVAGDFSILAEAGPLSAAANLENLADAANQFVFGKQPTAVTAGDVNAVTITAQDQFGNLADSYSGSVLLTSSDDQFQSSGPGLFANGVSTIDSEFRTAGTQSLIATDSVNGALTTTQNGIAVSADIVDNLSIVGGNNQSAVVDSFFADNLTVAARDRFGNAIFGESIGLIAADTAANGILQAASGLTASGLTASGLTDSSGLFTTRLRANTVAGSYSLQAVIDGLSTDFSLENLADTASRFVFSGQPTAVAAGDVNAVTITAQDQFGNLADTYDGSVAFTSSDRKAVLPETSLLINGVGRFDNELRTAGTHSITATDIRNVAIVGTQNNIIVNSDIADSLSIVGGDNQNTYATTAFADALTVLVRDRFGNPATREAVDFSAPETGASAVLTQTSALTDASGQVTTSAIANSQLGDYMVEVTLAGLLESFTLENTDPLAAIANPIIEADQLEESPDLLLANENNGTIDFFDDYGFEQLEQSLTENYTKYWKILPREGTSLEKVQQILQRAESEYKSRSALVYAVFVPASDFSDDRKDLFPGEPSPLLSRRLLRNETSEDTDQLLLLLIPPEGDPIQKRVDVDRKQLLRQAQLFNIELYSTFNDGYQPLARQLYDWLLAPIEAEIEADRIDGLMYVLDEGIGHLPIAALMKGDTFAIEHYGLSLLPSVSLLETNFEQSPAEQTILISGAETFTELESLPGVPIELDLVKSTATSSRTFFNEDFSIENIETTLAALPQNIVHVATHASFRPGALDKSYIQFWNEQLTLDDINELSLQDLELLILSACTTALGSRDAELGFAGLAAAAGVEASIGSLWNVSDLGTMALMAEFYEQLRENPLRFSALRAAQLSLLRGDARIEDNKLIAQNRQTSLPEGLVSQGNVSFKHPFFWSGFTLVGNPWW